MEAFGACAVELEIVSRPIPAKQPATANILTLLAIRLCRCLMDAQTSIGLDLLIQAELGG